MRRRVVFVRVLRCRRQPAIEHRQQIFERKTNLRLGFRFFNSLVGYYKGDVRLALLAYNRGEGAVDRSLRSGRDPENGYSHLVLGTRSSNPYKGRGVEQK